MARNLRRVAIIPSLFTVANGVCGFVAIIVASRIQPANLNPAAGPLFEQSMNLLHIAGWLIFAGMLFDVLDGRVARLTGAASKFGAELDSLCDVVTFGVAPAFLLLKMGPTPDDNWLLYRVLFVAATLYVVCTILRLARFNVETTSEDDHRFFKGLPSPAAAGCLASFAILRYDLLRYEELLNLGDGAFWPATRIASNLLPFGAMLVALLMVSEVRYPHFVNQSLRGRHPFPHLVSLLAIAALFLLLGAGPPFAIAFWMFAVVWPLKSLREPPPAGPGPPSPLETPREQARELPRVRRSHPELDN
ncbi:MAG TPA: CDP-diacylglycerol--serine O-phosphatidyltransferase [Planctomycetia bacterium]|nr:CDP-diacylglycerol--serine O-phosphatidyltransferase [Planctomycetia bacterium]